MDTMSLALLIHLRGPLLDSSLQVLWTAVGEKCLDLRNTYTHTHIGLV